MEEKASATNTIKSPWDFWTVKQKHLYQKIYSLQKTF